MQGTGQDTRQDRTGRDSTVQYSTYLNEKEVDHNTPRRDLRALYAHKITGKHDSEKGRDKPRKNNRAGRPGGGGVTGRLFEYTRLTHNELPKVIDQ